MRIPLKFNSGALYLIKPDHERLYRCICRLAVWSEGNRVPFNLRFLEVVAEKRPWLAAPAKIKPSRGFIHDDV